MATGMTPQGFVPKRLAEIQAGLNQRLGEITLPETGERPFQNVSDDTILQQIVGVFSEALSECWNAAYAAYTQFDPLKNSGAGQSGTVQLNAIMRKSGAPTILELELGGRPNTFVPRNSQVSTADGKLSYSTMNDAVIGGDGSVLVKAQATVFGEAAPQPGTVVKILTARNGWESVMDLKVVARGTKEETDEELRLRQQRSTSLTSYRLIEAIYAAVLDVPGVIYCRAYQNSSYQEDERGIPPKEVAVIAEGGDPQSIAEALFLRLPTGQTGYGSETVTLFDRQGYPYPISFSRPVEVEIWVNLSIRKTSRAEFADKPGVQFVQH